MKRVIGPIAFALGSGMAPVAVAAERLGPAPIEFPFIRLALALILCSLIALLAVLWLKRTMQAGALGKLAPGLALLRTPAREIRVFETHRVSPHADICRVTCGDIEYFIVVSAGGASVLRERRTEPPSTPAEPNA
jgi:hypothetical protein